MCVSVCVCAIMNSTVKKRQSPPPFHSAPLPLPTSFSSFSSLQETAHDGSTYVRMSHCLSLSLSLCLSVIILSAKRERRRWKGGIKNVIWHDLILKVIMR